MTETEKERLNRELMELLNELRVALPGVQVLFAFLLTIAFTTEFDSLSDTDRGVYFGSVITAALSNAFLMAPSAHHRMRFRDAVKHELVFRANVYAVVGLSFLVLTIGGVLYLIGERVFDATVGGAVGAAFGLGVGSFWFLVPRLYQAGSSRSAGEEREDDGVGDGTGTARHVEG